MDQHVPPTKNYVEILGRASLWRAVVEFVDPGKKEVTLHLQKPAVSFLYGTDRCEETNDGPDLLEVSESRHRALALGERIIFRCVFKGVGCWAVFYWNER